ncbi:hypothetical protein M8J75_000720 [Diaphorina citri]|nr:hypothetical protein M8J75_000720 [Diaphorina citri]
MTSQGSPPVFHSLDDHQPFPTHVIRPHPAFPSVPVILEDIQTSQQILNPAATGIHPSISEIKKSAIVPDSTNLRLLGISQRACDTWRHPTSDPTHSNPAATGRHPSICKIKKSAIVPDSTNLRLLGFNPKETASIKENSEYDWVSDGPLYDSGFIDNDGPLKKKLHPPQLSLELLSLPIGFPESIQGPLVILSTSAMTDLDSTFNTPVIDDVLPKIHFSSPTSNLEMLISPSQTCQ